MNNLQFIEYPPCSTCKKAKLWLDDHGITYQDRHIVKETPSKEELAAWLTMSKKPIKRFFNTSGKHYQEMHLKERFEAGLSDDEALTLLASDGMLIKRPLLVSTEGILIGFKPAEWVEYFEQNPN